MFSIFNRHAKEMHENDVAIDALLEKHADLMRQSDVIRAEIDRLIARQKTLFKERFGEEL